MGAYRLMQNVIRSLNISDGEQYDPYALYGRLPIPGRGFPPPPAPNARQMFIGEWD